MGVHGTQARPRQASRGSGGREEGADATGVEAPAGRMSPQEAEAHQAVHGPDSMHHRNVLFPQSRIES